MPNRARAALALSFILLVCPLVQAQKRTPKAATIGQLREQIRKMLAVDSDSATPPEIRELNRELLKERRAQLRELLQSRLDALLKYRAELKDSMTPDLDSSLRKSINSVLAEMNALDGAPTRKSEAARAGRVASATVARDDGDERAESADATGADAESSASDADAETDADAEPAQSRPVSTRGVEILASDTVSVEKMQITVRITDPNVEKLEVTVADKDGKAHYSKTGDAAIVVNKRGDDVRLPVDIELKPGKNRLTVKGVTTSGTAKQPVTLDITRETTTASGGTGGGGAATPKASPTPAWIKINSPKPDTIYEDRSLIKLDFTVQKPESAEAKTIDQVFVSVLNGGNSLTQPNNPILVPKKGSEKEDLSALVRIAKGKNEIRLFTGYKPGEGSKLGEPIDLAVINIECTGDRCGAPVADDFSNSMNMRAIIGFEQAGASSADSKTDPFLDLFFFGPLRYGNTCKGQTRNFRKVVTENDKGEKITTYEEVTGVEIDAEGCYPTYSTWGNVRFSSVPQQVSA